MYVYVLQCSHFSIFISLSFSFFCSSSVLRPCQVGNRMNGDKGGNKIAKRKNHFNVCLLFLFLLSRSLSNMAYVGLSLWLLTSFSVCTGLLHCGINCKNIWSKSWLLFWDINYLLVFYIQITTNLNFWSKTYLNFDIF